MDDKHACFPGSAWSATEVQLHLTSGSNHFMAEIARMFAEGFAALGVPATLRFDEVPSPGPANCVHVLVAPHELFPLFLQRKLSRYQLRAVTARAWCLNTEQPGSSWFETAFRYAARSRGVFDINRQGVAEFARRGVPAMYTPLGYAPSLEEPAEAQGVVKDIDIVFLGHHSDRRGEFLAEHADVLAKYNCRLVLADVDQPRQAHTPGFVAGVERNRLLRRARILLNVHSANRRYFEWHRAVCAMANRCLLVSETSEAVEPLVPGEHLVLAPLEELWSQCQRHLADPSLWRVTTERAYEFLRAGLPIERSCQAMLQATGHAGDMKARLPAERRTFVPLPHAFIHSAVQWVREVPAAASRVLRHWPLSRKLYYQWRARRQRPPRRVMQGLDRRRREVIARLDASEQHRAQHGQRPFDLTPNRRYEGAPPPDISIIVTLYNYAPLITACLRSVFDARQDGLPGGVEAIVVDDASTDDSARIAEQLLESAEVPGCLVRKGLNTGLADARNLGLDLARGRRVFVLDADNLIYPDCLIKLRETLVTSDAAGAYGLIKRFDGNSGKSAGLLSHLPWDPVRLAAANYIDAMALLDREKVLSVGGYSTELVRSGWFGLEDYDLWLKFLRAGFFCRQHPEIVASYRVHGSSMIRATAQYQASLAAHLARKFPDLAAKYSDQGLLFGYPQARRPAAVVDGMRSSRPCGGGCS